MSIRPTGRRSRGAWLRRPVAVLAAVLLGVTAQPVMSTAAQAAGDGARATVNKDLLAELATKGRTSFTVYLRERASLSGTAGLRDSGARATEVYQRLTGTAQRSQAGLRSLLAERKAPYTAYWIANAVRVTGDKALVDLIAARSDVERLEPARTYKLVDPVSPTVGAGGKTAARAGTQAVEWGLTNIEAPRVWSEYGDRGEGVVVANIDSGVQYDHPALVGKYRGNLGNGSFDQNYNWYDPAGICPSAAPCDNEGHGTHTMGTMVGDDGAGNQIGVAPGAKWIAAKGCETDQCSDASLLAAGQWVLAPTDLNGQNPRPDLHPDIVNNSWGGGQNDPWYQQTVAAWRAAGIFPTFSNGNAGPACDTAGSPGDYPETYSAGAYDINNQIADFSSRGSSRVDGGIKPNIAAPGADVRSSVPNNTYARASGTSMAAPHVSGTVALLWSAAPSLRGDLAATAALLDDSATDVNDTSCGGTADDNNVYGEGRLNAYQAVTAAPRGAVGRVTGTVTNAGTGAPLAGATVSSEGRSATTGADGRYTLTLPAGEHTVTATAYGYASQTATVTVPEGGAVTRDFALVASPTVTISGTVTDGSGHGWPLYARIEVTGRPGGPIFTNPVDGRFSFTVPGDATYKLTTTVRYPGYRTVTTDVAVAAANKTVNIAVPVDASCTAPGYSASLSAPLLSESFDGAGTPAGWSVVNRTSGGGWQFDDPGGRGNLTGGAGGFAIVDSDALGIDNSQDTDLRTPPVDLSGANAPVLRFNSDFRAVGTDDSADVDVSVDNGATWTNVWHQTASRRGPTVEEVPLTPAAGAAGALVRFHYVGDWDWWWEVDNVQIINRNCTPATGGLVVGFTTDQNTGSPLNGVKVSSVDTPADSGISAATPEDPNIPDGFYWLFSSQVGAHKFTATKSPYAPATKTVTVVADAVKRADFALKAGRLSVTPGSIESYQPYGSTRSTTLTVTNSGSAAATVQVLERPGGFDLLGRQGAALSEHRMKGISKAQKGVKYGARGNPAAAAPSQSSLATAGLANPASSSRSPGIDDAWVRVADLPAELYDNAAATLNGKVYSVGGGSDTGLAAKAYVYDPDGDAWTTLPDLPSARSKPTAAAVNGRLYVLGGWAADGTPVASVDVFDPATGSWSTLSGVTNPAPRAAAGGAVVGGKVYLVAGCADAECTDSDSTVVFDPKTASFSAGAAYPHSVSWLSCGGISGGVYCAGGLGSTEFTDTYRYDPAGDDWARLPDMPTDLWGSQYAAANGLLVLAGGVTGGSTAVTNRTIGYDPAAGAWQDLPNAQFSRYRGAGSCGAYKIGGSPTSFVGSKETEHLPGLDRCVDEGDVPWLSESPETFTLAPGASRTVTVTLTATAAAGVAQPGTYTAELGFRSDTPYQVGDVPVTMHVQPPASWGKLQGTVVGQTCAGDRVPVKGATVRVNSLGSPGTGYTLSTDAQGRYVYWVPKGRYEVIAAKDGWIPQVTRIQVDAGFVKTLDWVLAPVTPCGNRASGL
ncbi:S8 family serine peptidase [Plantactinospora siamensis]|uniref:S8 family serine peptidase n=1 Tax=Plantactinospora siamensis TaxID=555372 RepID=A0ABV6P5X7_9ACTN